MINDSQVQSDFDRWANVKKSLEFRGKPVPVKRGEVYWVGLGMNVGSEIDGKGRRFARPMVVLRVINRYSFIGVPLTTKAHDWPGFVRFEYNGVTEYALMQQVRVTSTKRLYNRIGRLDPAVTDYLRSELKDFLEL